MLKLLRRFFYLIILNISLIYAQGGPMQPEVTQFEPVDITDMVNLSTGDFIYSIPLMEVLGPEGGFPISISYHAGIGINQPATWVGLGWSLNPGSINRIPNGYPDDYLNELVQTHYEASRSGYGIGVGVSFGPIGLNINYDSNEGFGGSVSFTANVLGEKSPFQFGPSFSAGTSGANVGLGMSYSDAASALAFSSSVGYDLNSGFGFSSGISAYYSSGNSLESISLVGFCFSSKGGGNISFSGAGLSTSSTPGSGSITSLSATLPIPFTSLSLSYYTWQWRLEQTDNEYCYGYIHQDNFREMFLVNQNIKYERQKSDVGDMVFSAQDQYAVSAMGVGGTFMPFYDAPYFIGDDNVRNGILKDRQGDRWYDNNYYRLRKDYLVYRFLNDPGKNFITHTELENNIGWGEEYTSITNLSNSTDNRRYSSKVIEHHLDSFGKIVGFTITDSDGKIYEFFQPIYVYLTYTKNMNQEMDENEDFPAWSYSVFEGKYATSWLLTAIKGSDYIDRGNEGCDEQDWGYWIKFNYNDSYGKVTYRTPSYGYAPLESTSEGMTISFGLRDYILLNSIESSTHVAIFQTEDALDRASRTVLERDIDNNPIIDNNLIMDANAHLVDDDKLDLSIEGNWVPQITELKNSGTNVVIGWIQDLTGLLRPYYISDIITYEYIDRKTVIKMPRKDVDVVKPKAYFDFRGILNPNFYYEQKLSSILLYKKDAPNIQNQNGLWTSSSTDNSLSVVEFIQDYSLCEDTYTSYAPNRGKSTLKSIKFYGKNHSDVGIPEYQFDYGDLNNKDINPDFDIHNWDRWGSYKDPSTGRGINEHLTPQDKTLADKVAAWSLKQITTPTGATIDIEYESDDYYHVQDGYDFLYANSEIIDHTPSESNEFYITNIPEELFVGKEIFVCEEATYSETYYHDSYIIRSMRKRIITGIDPSTHKITVEQPLRFSDDQVGRITFSYSLFYLANRIFGGGCRVKSLTSSDGINSCKTEYQYMLSNGQSSGVTASLPPQYRNKLLGYFNNLFDNEDLDPSCIIYKEAYLDHPLSNGRPSPDVIYSRVTVKNIDSNNDNLYGATVYEFYTAYDKPYFVENNATTRVFTSKNYSSLYGQPKSISYYKNDGGTNILVKENTMDYVFSTELKDNNNLVINGSSSSFSDKPVGLTQEKYGFFTENNTTGTLVERQYLNAYPVSSSTTLYNNNSTSEGVTTKSRNFRWDAISGAVITTAVNNSKNGVVITDFKPAYWNNDYSEMKDKNMLTQTCKTTLYLSDAYTIDSDLTGYSFPTSDITKSTVITWNNSWGTHDGYADNTWRVNDTYSWIGKTSYQEFPFSVSDPGDLYNNMWQRTSNITKYDRYSHPTEERKIDGNYVSSIYGYGDALPVAIVAGAQQGEFGYSGFESGFESWEQNGALTEGIAHTGNVSVLCTGYEPMKNFYISNGINKNKSYIAEVWVKSSSGAPKLVIEVRSSGPTIFGTAICTTNGWTLYKAIVTPAQMSSMSSSDYLRVWCGYDPNSGGGSGYFDDIRFYPQDASMSTYTYDDLGKVTSITDDNNTTTYYIYDSAGRLAYVKDQDGNYVQKHSYKYSRSN